MQQPQFLRDEKSSPGELLAHCKSISTGSKVRLLFSILSSEQMMTCLDNHTITGQSLDLGECSWAVKLKGGERAEPAVPQHKARSPHTSDGWNPKAKGLCRQGNFKEVPTCSSHQLPCCRLQFPWSPWCNCLWGCSVKRLQTQASLNRVYKNALKQTLWSSFQHKPINNNSKTNWVEHCIPGTLLCLTLLKKTYIAKLHCETQNPFWWLWA